MVSRFRPALRHAAVVLTLFTFVALAGAPGAAAAAERSPDAVPTAVIASAPAGAPGWSTLFRDDFDGPAGAAVGPQWEHEIGTWGTGAVDRTTASTANVFLDGAGALGIRALRDASGDWTSGRIITADKSFSAPAGGRLLLTASIRLPAVADATGYWPAFWALGRDANAQIDWPRTGEIDMLEAVNGTPQVIQTLHCDLPDGGACDEPFGITSGLQDCASCLTGFHTYSTLIDRTEPGAERLEFFVDAVSTHVVEEAQVGESAWDAAVPNDFFLILNLAIGGGLPNGVCGCDSAAAPKTSGGTMSVEHVAVYRSDPAAPPIPTIAGTPTSGSTLIAASGRGVPVAYQWKADGVAIAGAAGSSFTLPGTLLGKRVTVTVSASDGSDAATSLPTAPVTAGTLGAVTPTISGTAKLGSTLTANPGTWTPSPVTLTYRWKADGVDIAGATGKTLKVATTNIGKRITVTVTGSKVGFTSAQRTSAPTAVVR
ncbi:family 16 glycosylhydrolase [Microbacterium sp. VKM Ac-2923]|uniref:family 16 glycosylhydrolase n=1 Tax=Microbacterium sp. VKM Ac-2923 TaxID=2929476 RepID=UPI001FB43E8B|nr:family 16 glycosylhydrolase [Microbacterium sp. VKM Ac-2923]MCJ1708666.1 family 16 glycosylhydrolase [Microbacterium sp. VKM Ac-2923]